MPLAVFDLDGTLVSSAEDLISTLNYVLKTEGLEEVEVAPFRPWVGFGAKKLMEKGFAANGLETTAEKLDALLPKFLDHYEQHMAVKTRLFDGARPALDDLIAHDWTLAVCTNKSTRLTGPLLEKLEIEHLFAAVVAGDTYANAKPHAEPLLGAIQTAGGTIETSVMVGDTSTDINAARAADVPVIAVDFGYSPVPIQDLKPDHIISHFDELFGAIKTLLPEQ
ncbi:phosphoglycolate phosphatase, bacterial [Roseibium sp. TrichSKD4]|uniref:HAD family hydrolase n=1 Tax=Roseibium sp. TrichSKD4 TaxID=744980 RepID=UPI0001E5778B|nr:HAD family hydrolase [Roseibium sp. TrichSKD4]EFO29546.1 phosphoglycolate phosphatase, bacterial [Roseibium sp. TrichSKD4]